MQPCRAFQLPLSIIDGATEIMGFSRLVPKRSVHISDITSYKAGVKRMPKYWGCDALLINRVIGETESQLHCSKAKKFICTQFVLLRNYADLFVHAHSTHFGMEITPLVTDWLHQL